MKYLRSVPLGDILRYRRNKAIWKTCYKELIYEAWALEVALSIALTELNVTVFSTHYSRLVRLSPYGNLWLSVSYEPLRIDYNNPINVTLENHNSSEYELCLVSQLSAVAWLPSGPAIFQLFV